MRLWGILVVALLLISCSPSAKVTVLPNEPIVEPVMKTYPAPVDEPETIKQPEPEVTHQFSDTPIGKWQSLIYNVTRIRSHEWVINHGITGGAKFQRRAHLEKITFFRPKSLSEGTIIDQVYFDVLKRRATAFCRDHEKPCEPYADKRFPVKYNDFYVVTPREWMLQFANQTPDEFEENAQLVNDRQATMIVFKNPRGSTTLWIDTYSKLPTRVTEVFPGGSQDYNFEELLTGKVTANDVFH